MPKPHQRARPHAGYAIQREWWSQTETLRLWKNNLLPVTEAAIARAAHLAAAQELQALDFRRAALLSRVAVYRVALASPKILSDDILSEIFGLCSPGPVELNHITGPRSRPQDIRLVLCQICSRWRRIALDNHRLWSEVQINFRNHNFSRALEVLPLWLSRAGGCTLSLEIDSETYDSRVSKLITRYSHQCHTIILNGLQFSDPFFCLPAGSLRCVETLRLKSNYRYGSSRDLPDPALAPILVFDDMPLLSSVTLDAFYHLFDPKLMLLPWHQLTSVYFDNTFPTAQQYYSVLAGCVHITKSRLDVFPPTSGGKIELSDRKIALPALLLLELNTDVLGNAARFLQSVALESLVDLSLSLSDDYDGTVFTVRAFPALQRLSLEGGVGTQSDLEAWLYACPAAVEVWVPDYVMQQPIMDKIADGRLLPRVELFTLQAVVPSFLIVSLEARLRSCAHSTIIEIGFTGSQMVEWELEESEEMRIARLRMVGVFVATCPEFPRPLPGQIKKAALLNAQQGLKPFATRKKLPFA
ncbi:hypothetical protein B0H19DRAFT_1076537 [Mycena capillaripes]|nr:hypothetical protein B0H19DRAFT_1076537 [Mycena capillaripes]